MRIKLSKAQWQRIGKTAGWDKTSQFMSGFETILIGSTPHGEDCAQVGSDDYQEKMRIELKAFYNQLMRMFPNIPAGAKYKRTSNPHDFGTYHEIGIKFSEDDEEAAEYAYNVQNNTPEYWDEQAKAELAQQGYVVKDRP